MKLISIILLILLISFILELLFKPRFDYTRDGWILLWFGRKDRKYIRII
jgi:hypothetical protein